MTNHDVNLFRYETKAVFSRSMEPLIKTEAVILIDSRADRNELVAGDIITFLSDKEIVITHRIVTVLEGEKCM